MHVCGCVRLYGDSVLGVCVWLCVYCDCRCLQTCMHVYDKLCLYGGCVAFACVSGHVRMLTVGVCVGVCMFVNVCDCMVIVLCLYVLLVMFVW